MSIDDSQPLAHLMIKMEDGKPAWKSAEANGISLQIFRRRLAWGWSADKAATHPPPPSKRKSPPQRPSLKLTTFLTDGTLAWTAAEAKGISEALFYARLKKGMTPDELVNTPVMPRGWRRRARI